MNNQELMFEGERFLFFWQNTYIAEFYCGEEVIVVG